MKNKMLIFFLIFIGVLIGSNIYLANRIAWFFSFGNAWPLYIILPIITFSIIAGGMGLINSTSTLGSITYQIAAILMGYLLYLLLSTIALDLFTIFVKLQPKTTGLIVLSLAAIISLYGIWNASNTRIKEVDISISGLQRPIKAAHLTDTHIGHFRGPSTLQKIVDKINNEDVEVVFFTGDLLDSKIQLKPESLAPLKNLNAPVYFVEGNHDVYTGTDPIKQFLRDIGVFVLTNEIANWKELQIIGLDHMLADENAISPHADPKGPNIKNTLLEMELVKRKPTVLLHHGPDGIKYAKEKGIDLYLAGHTHGGQLWPITHVANMLFEVNKGLHKFDGTQVYVSQGTGTFGPPMRVGTYSELTILNLIPG